MNKIELIKAQMLLKVGIDEASGCKDEIFDFKKQNDDFLKKKNIFGHDRWLST